MAVAPNGTTFAAFNQDRLGSQGTYYPYGEDKGTPLGNDQFKFGTYWRDSATGLDYADQRYFVNNFGRFMTPDPYGRSMQLKNPGTFNRYAYVHDDPINLSDPNGECELRDCVSRGLKIIGGGLQVIGGGLLFGASVTGEIASGGTSSLLSALGAIGSVSLVGQGVLNISAGITGDNNLSNAATVVNVVNNPAGLATLVGTGGNVSAANTAATAYDIATSVGQLGTALYNSIPNASGLQAAQVVTAPFISITTAGTGTIANILDDAGSSMVHIYTPPTTVGAQAPTLDYVPSQIDDSGPLVFGGGGGGGEELAPEEEDDYFYID